MNYDISEVDRLTQTTTSRRNTLFRWLAQQGELTRIEAIKLQTDLIRQQRPLADKAKFNEFVYSMYMLALQKMHWLESAQNQKAAFSADQAARLSEIRIDRIKAHKRAKKSPKKELIRLRYYHLIVKLREEGLSWRQVADYLITNHKVKFGFSYLRESFNKLTAEKGNIGT